MIGLAIVTSKGVQDCLLTQEQITGTIELDEESIPLQSLELWYMYYEWMSRKEKVEMIQRALKGNKHE